MPYKNIEKAREASRRYYARNREAQKKRVKIIRDKARKLNRELFWDFLISHPCVDCGETNPIMLELDHRDRTTKTLCVSKLLQNRASWGKILTEIDKCDVRCANCHRMRTAMQLGWYKEKVVFGKSHLEFAFIEPI